MIHMAVMGLLTSALAPTIILLSKRLVAWHKMFAPPTVVLPGFLLLHAAVTIGMATRVVPMAFDGVLHTVLLAAAIWFWLPVLAPADRITDAGRSVYLFLAGPSLDLPAVFLIILGDAAGGLAMIVAMLPVGLAAVLVTWRWITGEERLAGKGALR